MGSGRETIEARDKAHKRADSGVVVGNGARIRSLAEALRRENKQAFVMPRIRGEGACSRLVAQRFFCRNEPAFFGRFCRQRDCSAAARGEATFSGIRLVSNE